MKVFETRNRGEYEVAMQEAKAQERVVNKLYIEYHGKAKIVADMFAENGNEPYVRSDAKYPLWAKALAAKQAAHVAWQREAHKHGAMFVDLKRPDPSAAPKEETVW